MDMLLQILALVGLLFLSAFFSGSETAFLSLDAGERSKFEAERSLISKAAVFWTAHPWRFLATVVLGNMAVNTLASSIAAGMLWEAFGKEGILLATLCMTWLILLFGETVPKSLGVRRAEAIFRRAALPLMFFSWLVFPFRELLRSLMSLVTPGVRNEGITEEELRTAVGIGHKEGVLEDFERELIQNILRVDRMAVREVMTPRIEIFSLDAELPIKEAGRIMAQKGFSRVPIWEGDEDHIVGYVHIKDVLKAKVEGCGGKLKDIARKVDFVPESKRVGELLREFRRGRKHIAIVVDEYGDLAGIVTLEDLLEGVVGWIMDERERWRNQPRFLDGNRALVSARMDLERFNDLFGTEIDSEEAETIGGYLMERLGRVPKAGDGIAVGDVEVRVVRAAPNRVLEVEVRRLRPGGV